MSDIPAPADPRNTTSYRLLMAVVIFLGALIVIALGILVVGLVTRFSAQGPAGAGSSAARYELPRGSSIIASETQPGRLILRVRTQSGEEVDIIDTQNGHLVGQVKAPK